MPDESTRSTTLGDGKDIERLSLRPARRALSSMAVRKYPPLTSHTDDVLAAFDAMSRRINDLARELKCLGYFDDEDHDRPRAA